MLRKLWTPFVGGAGAVGLLGLRLLFGIGLVIHGWPKIQNATNWMGTSAPIPGFLQFLAAFSEFFGGLALIVGLLTPIAAAGVVVTMLVAILLAHAGDPFIGQKGQKAWELAGTYLASAFTLMLTGPGTLSLDYLLFGNRKHDSAD